MRALYLQCFPPGAGAGTVSSSRRAHTPCDVLVRVTWPRPSAPRATSASAVLVMPLFWEKENQLVHSACSTSRRSALGPAGRAEGRGPTRPPASRPCCSQSWPFCPAVPEITLTPSVLTCLRCAPHRCHSCGDSLTLSAPGLVLGPVGALRAPLKPSDGGRSRCAASCTVCVCVYIKYHPGCIQPHSLRRNPTIFISPGHPWAAQTDLWPSLTPEPR